MAFNFLLTNDLTESSILKSVLGSINMDGTLQDQFLFQTNEWYLEESLEFGVAEEDIQVYNPNIDTEDDRNRSMVRLATWKYLTLVFFSEWGSKDDIYAQKLPYAQKEFDKLYSKMTPERIIGEKPAETKEPDEWGTIEIGRC